MISVPFGKYSRSSPLVFSLALVERTSRYVVPVALPAGRRDATTTCNALISSVTGLPEGLVKTLTWDQGSEMAGHAAFTLATTVDVYFAHPALTVGTRQPPGQLDCFHRLRPPGAGPPTSDTAVPARPSTTCGPTLGSGSLDGCAANTGTALGSNSVTATPATDGGPPLGM